MDENTDTSTPTASEDLTAIGHLPSSVRELTTAHLARDADAVLAVLTPDAVITDEGHTYTGETSLRDFVTQAGAEFSYTDEITGGRRDGDVWVVGHHLEGDFPGGLVDLDYRFTLRGEHIARLDIVVGGEHG